MTAVETRAHRNRQLEAVRARMRRGGVKPGSGAPGMAADKSGLATMRDGKPASMAMPDELVALALAADATLTH